MKHSNHAQHFTPEPLPYKTGWYEYFAGACLGAILAVLILAVLILAAFGCLFVPA